MTLLELKNFITLGQHFGALVSFTIHCSRAGLDLYLHYMISDNTTIIDGYLENARYKRKRYATVSAILLDIQSVDSNFKQCNFILIQD